MNEDQIIEVLTAYKAGKTIQWKYAVDDVWLDFVYGGRPIWNFNSWSYRVKPEPPKPREFWICEKTGYALPIKHGGYVHVREVLE